MAQQRYQGEGGDVRRPESGPWLPVPRPLPLREALRRATRSAIYNALAYYDGHQRKAGNALGISERSMNHHMNALGVPRARALTTLWPKGRKQTRR